jgi:hypothetical protein
MHIRQQRLLTSGQIPTYPPAFPLMAASDLHHGIADLIADLSRACEPAKTQRR